MVTEKPSASALLFSEETLKYHLDLLGTKPDHQTDEISLAPIIASSALQRLQEQEQHPKPPSAQSNGQGNPAATASTLQYGLLAGSSRGMHLLKTTTTTTAEHQEDDKPKNALGKDDPRLLFNISAPSSTFICGSQGSGKSHTLSCILEACLMPSRLGRLVSPLTGAVFHYDTFISDNGGSPCEAAFLASDKGIKVRVLCAPTNYATIKKTYSRLNVTVEPLQIDQLHLNTKRMMDLMAVSQGDVPLYMESVKRILREMRMIQQQTGGRFDYQDFRRRINACDFTPGQLAPLTQRLETLESFMSLSQTKIESSRRNKGQAAAKTGTDWTPVPGRLTVVDLSCPCVSPETACSLFNICLGIFLQQDPDIGRVFALDEAHKYMTTSPEAAVFTETILSAVRLQRHLGVRAIISTQEPTISTALLNLCSVTIVHRFTSPEWLRVLRGHLAAAATDVAVEMRAVSSTADVESQEAPIFERIIQLRVGEALLFAPSAVVDVHEVDGERPVFKRLGGENMAITVRGRLTHDGGKSILSL